VTYQRVTPSRRVTSLSAIIGHACHVCGCSKLRSAPAVCQIRVNEARTGYAGGLRWVTRKDAGTGRRAFPADLAKATLLLRELDQVRTPGTVDLDRAGVVLGAASLVCILLHLR
jgi:hypothetical protein